MTYTWLPDEFADRPGILALSDAAFRANIEATVWSNKQLTDGRVPRERRALRRILSVDDIDAAVNELVKASVWTESDDDYQVDWSHQETKEKVTEKKAQNRLRDERRRRHNRGDHTLCDPQRCWHLLAHPDLTPGLTRETQPESTRDTPRDSRPPTPTPTPSRRSGRSRDEIDAAQGRVDSPEERCLHGHRIDRGTCPEPECIDAFEVRA
jgi:hypothetical protein